MTVRSVGTEVVAARALHPKDVTEPLAIVALYDAFVATAWKPSGAVSVVCHAEMPVVYSRKVHRTVQPVTALGPWSAMEIWAMKPPDHTSSIVYVHDNAGCVAARAGAPTMAEASSPQTPAAKNRLRMARSILRLAATAERA